MMDWNDLPLEDDSVDAWISDQGVAKYGTNPRAVEELTRVSKPGAILRATKDTGIVAKKTFSELLVDYGWTVYEIYVKTGSKINWSRIICARLPVLQ
jgi:ubiquinone/menaquinone biosynthesis C-methylase UbiE